MKLIKLTITEVYHLLHLIECNQDDGTYWGRKDQYEKRAEVIKLKLEEALHD